MADDGADVAGAGEMAETVVSVTTGGTLDPVSLNPRERLFGR